MNFCNTIIVQKPRKTYKCELCHKIIEIEPHNKTTGVQQGDFFSYRTHIECQDIMLGICDDCDFNCDCGEDFESCFAEYRNERGV